MKGQITFIIKPVSMVCNLACNYCYNCYLRSCDLKTLSDKRMKYSVTKTLFQQISEIENEPINFIWHGGEPFLAGLEFYEEISNQQEKCLENKNFHNSFQTNGTLIDRQWVDFSKKRKFKIGISLDGPKEVHDRFRKFPNNTGSFSLIMHNIEILKEEGLDIGIISVITKNSVKSAKKIMDFFIERKLYRINFSACAERNGKELQKFSVSPSDWADFMIEVFDYWMEKDNPEIKIQLLENLFQGLIGGRPTLCYCTKDCNRYIAVDSNGDIYLCGRFMGIEYFKLGNIFKQSLKSILSSKKYKEISSETKTIKKECLNCHWEKVCNGGCSYYRFMNEGTIISPYYFCSSTKKLLKHMNSAIKNLDSSVLKF